MPNKFLPISQKDLHQRGWKELDIILITGDAYVDHPSFGTSVIGRMLEHHGFRVGIIAQPDWRGIKDFMELGKPRLFFGVSSGNVDSMIANYTANKRPRKTDDYSPNNKAGLRPDRAVIVYSQMVRQAFKDSIIVIGGIEASLRRLAHYDYWDNCVRRSILLDSKADILVYGMGESQILTIANRLRDGRGKSSLNNIKGTVVVSKEISAFKDSIELPSFEDIKDDKQKFNHAYKLFYEQLNPFTAKTVVQKHADRYCVQFPPPMPLSQKELDEIYELPYTRRWHPIYDKQGEVKALKTVQFSLISHRGCFGECSFCALNFHQGKIIQNRSIESIVREAKSIAQDKDFHGTITDIGGPTANMYAASCHLWQDKGFCKDKKCLAQSKCRNLKLGYDNCLSLYRAVRAIPKVKHVFIGSGLRFDLLVDSEQKAYLEEICKNHISGYLKVAPEHYSDKVLDIMNKPKFSTYEKFVKIFNEVNKKNFLVNYFLLSHPGSTLSEVLKFALYLKEKGIHPEQIQDFIPSPMLLSTCLYWTGVHPLTGERIYVPTTFTERKMQRALIQYQNPSNRPLIIKALREMKAMHLLREFNIGRNKNSRHPH